MKTGLFFGSFNPVHIGHMAIANFIVEFTDIEEIWFIISPHNPLKEKSTLLDSEARLNLLKTAIGTDKRFVACDLEFKMQQPSYTIDTLEQLTLQFPQNEFVLIMGSDGLESFTKWKKYKEIIKHYTRYIYPRTGGKSINFSKHKNIRLIDAPVIDISSTFLRKSIAAGHNMRQFLPTKVYDFIFEKGYYRD
jgi:nicotinate-nucleotide adenylyltransferase